VGIVAASLGLRSSLHRKIGNWGQDGEAIFARTPLQKKKRKKK